MSHKLSTPVKIAALAGIVLALAGGVALLLFRGHSSPSSAVTPTVPAASGRHGARTHRGTRTAAHRVVIDPYLPAPVREALRTHRIVVAILYSPTIPEDGPVLLAGSAAAFAAHAGVAVLNLANERTAEAVAGSLADASDPGVLVIRRPGKVVTELDGLPDAQTVEQAVADARR